MRTISPGSLLLVSALALLAVMPAALAATPPLPAFSAHYRLLRNGHPIGEATLTLARGSDNTWIFTTDSRGTSGLAAVLGARTHETSTFRWSNDLPQGESYTYTMDMTFKHRQRKVHFDWANHTIEVDDHGTHRFPAVPGAIERHTVPLALAAGLAAGQHEFSLAVAVRDRIETQRYVAHGKQPLTVPAGTYDAVRVSRTDGGAGLEAWFATDRLPVPVKIDQGGDGGFSLELESWTPRPSP